MAVRVDKARRYSQTGGINDFFTTLNTLGNLYDFSVLDCYVCLIRGTCCSIDNAAVFNYLSVYLVLCQPAKTLRAVSYFLKF